MRDTEDDARQIVRRSRVTQQLVDVDCHASSLPQGVAMPTLRI